MADSYSMVPLSALDDERLDGDAGPVRAAYALILLVTDDWGRFEGDVDAMARRLGVSPDWMGRMFAELEERGLIDRYEAPGRRRLVGEVIGYTEYSGHAPRKSAPSTRAASLYPGRDGAMTPGKNARRAAPEADPSASGKTGQGRGKVGARSGQAAGKAAGKTGQARGRAEERRGEEIRDPPASQSDHAGPPRAPAQPTPAASTDARATGDIVDAAPPPALGAREAQHEYQQGEAQAPYVEPYVIAPEPEPPPARRSRAQEAERRAKVRADYERTMAIDAAEKARQVAS